jgi:hypothetical protein
LSLGAAFLDLEVDLRWYLTEIGREGPAKKHSALFRYLETAACELDAIAHQFAGGGAIALG